MRYAADLSVLLSWWKLLDARRDSRGPRRLAAKAALLLYRRSYRRASARHPALDAAFGTELARLQALEDEKSPSIDRTADAFASLLRDCAAHYDGRERRPEQLLLYHVGRYLYLADALEDLPRDVRAGAYNPLRYRYGADDGTLDPADRAQLLETIDASISMACSAMELEAAKTKLAGEQPEDEAEPEAKPETEPESEATAEEEDFADNETPAEENS